MLVASTTFTPAGEVAERPIAGALKAPEGKLSGGSNPSLAAAQVRGLTYICEPANWFKSEPANWFKSEPANWFKGLMQA